MHRQHQTLYLAALSIGGIALAAPAPAEAAAAAIPVIYPYRDTLVTGQSLLAGQGLISKSGDYMLVLQADGKLVEYYNEYSATWATETRGIPIDHATLQNDGNFVLYDEQDQPRWASGTQQWYGWNPTYKVVLQDDGYVAVTQTMQTGSFGSPMSWWRNP